MKRYILSILSAGVLYLVTNCRKISTSGYFTHEPWEVCPFGVLMGKVFSFLLLIQACTLSNPSLHPKIKYLTKHALILGFLLSFMNIYVLCHLIPVYIMQYILICSL